jgi:hypothetical protein
MPANRIKLPSEVALGRRDSRRYGLLLEAARDIVRSPAVSEFCVGISAKIDARRASYRRWCQEHDAELRGFVALDWNRKCEQILACEEYLFRELVKHPKYATGVDRYYRSGKLHLDNHAVYIAWWSPAFNRELYDPE